MKKYKTEDIEEAIKVLKSTKSENVAITDYLYALKVQLAQNVADEKFVKAPNSYLKKLKRKDVYTRPLRKTDIGYYPGMYGLFEKKTHKLLRRHTDLGYLSLPSERDMIITAGGAIQGE